MAAPRKYPDEVRDRAVRLVLDIAESAGSVSGRADLPGLAPGGVDGIAPSTYYAARSRPPSARTVRDAWLEGEIVRVFKASGERSGAGSWRGGTCTASTFRWAGARWSG